METLVAEANHRAANSLQLALGLLKRQAHRSDSSIVRTELLVAASQLSSIVLVHRRLFQTRQTDGVDLSKYLGELVDEMSAALNASCLIKLQYVSVCRDLCVSSVTATRLGLIVTEVLTNCAKHAGAGRSCYLALSCDSHTLDLTILDDGPGLPADFERKKHRSTGMQLIESLCSSLGGTFASPVSGAAACFVIRIPIQRARPDSDSSPAFDDENASAPSDIPETDRMLLTALARKK
jgi:two-component sensor histidine kinase